MTDFVRFGFISGELTPFLHGRTDLEKYDLGVAKAYNWFVDYRGGASTRPGTEFCEFAQNPNLGSKLAKFTFSPDTADTYVLLFTNFAVRFLQGGSYVLEGNKTLTAVSTADQARFTSAAHGFSDNDWVIISSAPVGMEALLGTRGIVKDSDTNTFRLQDNFGNYISTRGLTYVSGGVVNRVYTVVTPYQAADLDKLRVSQVRDTLRLTHRLYKPRDLVRNNHANWTLSLTEFSNKVQRPTGGVASATEGAGGAIGCAMAYAVTAVDFDGNESAPSDKIYLNNVRNPFSTDGPNTFFINWDTQSDIWFYNVYRTVIYQHTADIDPGADVGFIGKAFGPRFIDQANIPDFTKAPPLENNPFADSRINRINVLTGGTGYDLSSQISITTSTGSGFVGFPVVIGDVVEAIVVVNGGEGYADTDTATVTVGSGATFEIVLGESSGNNPRVSSIFQQRQVYAATANQPVTVFGSQPGKFSNFDFSTVTLDSDEYEHEIDSSVVAPIKHLVALRGGLLALSGVGVWILSGENGQALTPKNALADPQSYTGTADVIPIVVGTDLLYVESHSFTVRLLSYKDLTKVYSGEDISLLSSHFFNSRQQVESMAYAAAPHKVVWVQRSDGTFLSLTLLRDQNIYGWTQHATQGYVTEVLNVSEHNIDVVYMTVERVLNGQMVKTVERFTQQDFEFVEDAWCVDCGLALSKTFPDADLEIKAATGDFVRCVASERIFTPENRGSVIRASGMKAEILDVKSDTKVDVRIDRPVSKFTPFTTTPAIAKSGTWTMDPTYTSITVPHLAGMDVVYLADGNVGSTTVGTDGTIPDLPNVSRMVVGLKFVCDLQTLPLHDTGGANLIEGKLKRVSQIRIDQYNAVGLKTGADFDHLYELKERKNEGDGQPTDLQHGYKTRPVAPKSWDAGAAACIRQDNPLPATVRAIVLETEVEG